MVFEQDGLWFDIAGYGHERCSVMTFNGVLMLIPLDSVCLSPRYHTLPAALRIVVPRARRHFRREHLVVKLTTRL